MALTDKKRRFVQALQSGMSGAKAAIHAGYSENGAKVAASRLMRDKDVLAALERGKNVNPEVNKSATVVPSAQPPMETPQPGTDGVASADLLAAIGIKALGLTSDPKAILIAIMNDANEEPKLRMEAAKALMPFVHGKVAEQGKKDAQKEAAAKAAGGKFGRPAAPPGLRVVNGGK